MWPPGRCFTPLRLTLLMGNCQGKPTATTKSAQINTSGIQATKVSFYRCRVCSLVNRRQGSSTETQTPSSVWFCFLHCGGKFTTLASQSQGGRKNMAPVIGGFNEPVLVVMSFPPIVCRPQLVTWPHLSARGAGKCSPCLEGRRQEEKILTHTWA